MTWPQFVAAVVGGVAALWFFVWCGFVLGRHVERRRWSGYIDELTAPRAPGRVVVCSDEVH